MGISTFGSFDDDDPVVVPPVTSSKNRTEAAAQSAGVNEEPEDEEETVGGEGEEEEVVAAPPAKPTSASAAKPASADAERAKKEKAAHIEFLDVLVALPNPSKEKLAKLTAGIRDAYIRTLERHIGKDYLSQEESERAAGLVNQLRAVKERAIVFSSVGDKIFARAFKDVADAPLYEAQNTLEQLLLHSKTNFPNTAKDVESLLGDIKKEIADRKAAAAPAEPPPPVAPAAADVPVTPPPAATPTPTPLPAEGGTTRPPPPKVPLTPKAPLADNMRQGEKRLMVAWWVAVGVILAAFIFAANHDWEADPSAAITAPHRDPARPATHPTPHAVQPPAPVHTLDPAHPAPAPQAVPTPQPETRCVPGSQAPVACNPTNPSEAATRHATWNCDHVAIGRYADGTYDLCQCRWCETPADGHP